MKPPVPQKEANNLPAVISRLLPSPPRGATDTAMAVAVCFCAGVLLSRDEDENGADGDEEVKDEDDDKWRDVDVGEMENPDAKQEQMRARVGRRVVVRMSINQMEEFEEWVPGADELTTARNTRGNRIEESDMTKRREVVVSGLQDPIGRYALRRAEQWSRA